MERTVVDLFISELCTALSRTLIYPVRAQSTLSLEPYLFPGAGHLSKKISTISSRLPCCPQLVRLFLFLYPHPPNGTFRPRVIILKRILGTIDDDYAHESFTASILSKRPTPQTNSNIRSPFFGTLLMHSSPRRNHLQTNTFFQYSGIYKPKKIGGVCHTRFLSGGAWCTFIRVLGLLNRSPMAFAFYN